MSILNHVSALLTARATTEADRLVEQTDNGVQPNDPPQDVSQDPAMDYGASQ